MAKILIVDDQPMVLKCLKSALMTDGHDIATVAAGDLALKLVGFTSFDIIITDYSMPRMDGITFIKNVREQDAYRDIPIVVLSTEGEDKDIQTGLSIGANLYMVKPAQPETMVKNIKMLLG